MLRKAAFKSALMAAEVVVSGYKLVMTSPLIIGGIPPQRPKPRHYQRSPRYKSDFGSNTTFPLIWVIGAVLVLVTPAVAAIANG